MGKSGYLLIFIFFFLLMTCQTSQHLEELKTELHLIVKDEHGNPISGAVVAVFNNSTTYLEKSPVYSTEGAIAVDTTANGVSVFTNLNSTDNYRISVHYQDKTTYPGGIIDYDNSTQYNTIPSKLYAGSVSNAEIKLKPANGLVVFWTGTENSLKLPMKIAFNNNVSDSITKTFGDKPDLLQPKVTVMKIKNGNYDYTISSKTGCVFNDTININGADLKYVKLDGCNTGRISFWAGLTLNSSLPITVIVNNNDTLGVINSVFSFTPTDCYASNLLFGDYLPANYSYTAVSTSSKLVWTGKITVAKDNCQLIEIK